VKRIALAAGLALSGCTLLAPAPDPSRFFVLAALGAPAATGAPLALGVGPVRLPGYLAVPEVQVRASDTEVRRSEIDRWAEPLDEGIARVLAQNLSTALGTKEVVLFPWFPEQRPAVQVALSVRRFELEPDGSGLVEGLYEVTDLASGRRAIREVRYRRPASGPDTAASIAALSQGLADLAAEIAGEVRGLRTPR
jgi:uncharacterized lipoprotein YmbA